METSIKQYLDGMKDIQTNLLDYLNCEEDMEQKYNNLKRLFDEFKIHDNQYTIKLLLHLILKISQNHHRRSDFFDKIEKILTIFKDDMKKYFPNEELFNIFKNNKRLLLFLLEENIMIFNESIIKTIIHSYKFIISKYPQYFQPEIQPFINEEWFPKYDRDNKWVEEIKKEIPDDFYEKRKIGENDSKICKLIQNDSIDEFIIHISQNCYNINSTINPSIYETNNFLLKNGDITLFEYSMFYGSIQIFNYLKENGAKLESWMLLYAIHGKNSEIIHFFEENKILPNKETFKESIKCHHIDVAYYIQDNYLQNEDEYSLINGLRYYNFMFITSNIDDEKSFCYLCKYDYYFIVFKLLQNTNCDFNMKLIHIIFFLIKLRIIFFNYIQNHIF